MQPDLPQDYYLDNVLTLFEHVSSTYSDLLEPRQLDFLEQFSALSNDAQKLGIRLLNRSHEWFRKDKLNYPEIASMTSAMVELQQAGFVEIDPQLEDSILLKLFTMPELRAALGTESGLGKMRRDELEQFLLERDERRYFQTLNNQGTLIQVLRRDDYQICQMLFFGNLNQSMTDFVLRDLGLYQFESYHIDPAQRPYQSQLEIQQHWLMYQLENLYLQSDLSSPEELNEIGRLIPQDIRPLSPAWRKSEQLRFEIARQLERIDELEAAGRLYLQCGLPPARERIARICDRQQQYRESLDLCTEMIADPIAEQERQFACMFATRLIKRHDFENIEMVEQYRISHQPDIVELQLDYHDSVETAVVEHYHRLDPQAGCYYVENSLFNAVLGLLIWEVIFAPVAGAFFNSFQYRPSDFYHHDFCARRRRLLDQTWAAINTNEDIWRIVSARWKQKYGLMNPLVNWQALNPELIELALARIEFTHWRVIFDRILQDLRNHRSGFPDLVHFPGDGGYELIEVKGPGDSLQKNQQRWMQFFHEQEIPHYLARVTWHKP